ncbi:MAG: hypothetical protein A2Y10_00170 [Planctomycetes bacterium GWF2_41_51]|nr:MAG: hypothetical protein A2Y10_00170 [Planctomycetes bacterium GWF2_41_51]HBG27095.1 hypothetical protein [Phycisphaerales bacterium]
MKKLILIQIILLSGFCLAQESSFRKAVPVRDGFMLDGIDGKITNHNDQWFFTAYEPTTDGRGVMTTPAEILPSSTLEKLTKMMTEGNDTFRIWGKLTTYNGRNYIYLSYFLQVADVVVEVNEPNDPNKPVEKKDANETQIIPEEALALLKPKRVINLTELRRPEGVEADGILSDRTGFLEQTKDGVYFGFDAMGRNVNLLQLPMLKCEELERIEKLQKETAFPIRFKISAIVTRYNGRNFLLVQQARRLYTHGNFGR